MQAEPEHRERLWENTRYLQGILRAMGLDIWESPTPAVPIVIGDKEKLYFIWKSLQEQGFFTVMSISPGVPVGKDLIRTAVSSLHTKEMLDRFGDALKVAIKKAGFKPHAGALFQQRQQVLEDFALRADEQFPGDGFHGGDPRAGDLAHFVEREPVVGFRARTHRVRQQVDLRAPLATGRTRSGARRRGFPGRRPAAGRQFSTVKQSAFENVRRRRGGGASGPRASRTAAAVAPSFSGACSVWKTGSRKAAPPARLVTIFFRPPRIPPSRARAGPARR